MLFLNKNRVQNEPDPVKKQQKLFGYALVEAGIEFALLIGFPLGLFIYIGRKLDGRFGTKYLVLVGIALAIMVSSVSIWRRIQLYKKLIK